MKYVGAHVSAAGGLANAAIRAAEIEATAFALFTKNQRQWRAAPLSDETIAEFKAACEKYHFGPGQILPHDSYLINLGHPVEEALEKSREAFIDELTRCQQLGLTLLNFHPGSHVGQGAEKGIELIAAQLNAVIHPEQKTTVLLETMAGKGTEVGRSFEELRAIIDRVDRDEKLGVCLDTCHVWDGGYDIQEHLDEVLTEFDNIIGLGRLKAIHLNDSQNGRGSHKDRHARIGEGKIGLEALVRVIRHPALKNLPFILETPNDAAGYAREIAMLREKANA